MNKGNWLQQYEANWQSQCGEDGILEKIFSILSITKGWCVELGAWDGIKYSNTHRLLTKKNWSGVLIEGEANRFAELKKNCIPYPNVYPFHQFVSFSRETTLQSVLAKTPIPDDFDLLSIDIDGNDVHLWESLTEYHPKVVIIEYNPTIPNHVSFVQPRDVHQGNSLKSCIELGKKKGYELIATTELNAIFVQQTLYSQFEIEDNSVDLMRPCSKTFTYLYQLYDGTLVLDGNKRLLWTDVYIRDKKIQIYPPFLRFYATNNLIKRALKRGWRFLYKRT